MRKSTRDAVRIRANHRCEYCCSPSIYTSDLFDVDHIVPKSKGGTDDLRNLAWSCSGCNSYKQAAMTGLDPTTSAAVGLFHPREHRWRDHFDWDQSKTLLVGRTEIGKATVERLQMNRPR